MHPVLIVCPVTNKLIATGRQAADWSDVEALVSEDVVRECPDCGHDHVWGPKDAALADAPLRSG